MNAGGESLVSHAGGVLLVETARRSGLAKELSARYRFWRRPPTVHDSGKIVLDVASVVALGGDAACDLALPRPARPVRAGGLDPTVSRLVVTLANDVEDALKAITGAQALARQQVWAWAGTPLREG